MNLPFAVFFGAPGWMELLILGGLALLLFGNRLPSVARSFGQSITEFKKGMKEIREDIEEDADSKDSKDSKDSSKKDEE